MIIVSITLLSKSGNLKVHGGAAIIVGPFPIIFANDKQSAKLLLVFSIALVGLLIVLFLIQGIL